MECLCACLCFYRTDQGLKSLNQVGEKEVDYPQLLAQLNINQFGTVQSRKIIFGLQLK